MNGPAFASRFGQHALVRLRAAFDSSAHSMLISDDRRRWVSANAAACELLGMPPEEVAWRSIDDFTPEKERDSLPQQWEAFLRSGAAEGWDALQIPGRGLVSVEFSSIANVLPGRHLVVFMPPDEDPEGDAPRAAWAPLGEEASGRLLLTAREREVMALIASGGHSGDIAQRLSVSAETIKSHVQNAMSKLGAHTRAHAVAIALIAGQISWPDVPDG